MRPLRSSIVTVLLLALATVPTTGVAAQGEASREPSAVLGWALDETHVWDGTSKEVDGVLQRRGPQYSYTWTADDPRLSGEALWTGSGDRYRASPTFEVQTATWELVNDDGRWVGESVGLQGPGLGESDTITLTVARLVRPPRVSKHEIRPLTPEQAGILIRSSVDDRLHALYVTALGTGLRQGELLGLLWDDVHLETGRLTVRHTLARVEGELVLLEPKTERSRRTIVLPEVVVSALRAHRTRQKMERLVAGPRRVDSGHVFTTNRGTPLDAATVTRSFQRALNRAALPRCRFHDLRHSAATFLLAQGFTLEDVKNLLGHSSIVLTSNTYGHVLERRQRQVASGMDIALGGEVGR